MFDASVYLAPLTPLAHFDLVTPQGEGKTSWLPARRVPRLLPSSSGPSATANVEMAFLRRTLLEDVQYSESSGDGLRDHKRLYHGRVIIPRRNSSTRRCSAAICFGVCRGLNLATSQTIWTVLTDQGRGASTHWMLKMTLPHWHFFSKGCSDLPTRRVHLGGALFSGPPTTRPELKIADLDQARVGGIHRCRFACDTLFGPYQRL